jgi:osmoprotectant transport system permease protein
MTAHVLLAAPNLNLNLGGTSSCVQNNGGFCLDWFRQNWGSIFVPALEQHILMTVIAVAIGFVISFGLAIAAYFLGFLAKPVTLFASLLYTIPSLAAFQILVPITGINYFTVELALVAYSLLVLFTNTLAGISGVSADVLDASRGVGMTRTQILWRVQVPLAMPTIVAGIRVAVITVISLATIAAFLIPYGLGKPIFDALGLNDFNTEFITAGALCILLALVADALLAGTQRVLTPWARRSS